MKVTITIQTDNAVFQDVGDPSIETARILKELASKIDGHPHFSPGFDYALHDLYGNECGYLTIKKA